MALQTSFKFWRSVSAIAAAGVLAACATGSSSTSGSDEIIDKAFIKAAQTWDLNRDGTVTCDEWHNYALSLFREADANHDGKLTPEEFAKIAKRDHLFDIANFKYYDTDGDGFVTQAEFVDRPNPAFVQLDKEKTCKLQANVLRATNVITATPTMGDPTAPGADPHRSPPGR